MSNDKSVASFVENVNIVANATKLATGDVIEDAQLARDEAVRAANEARLSAINAESNNLFAHEWANKAYNSEVYNGEYSSYHWSVVSYQNSGEKLIQDLLTSTKFTWSSDKIQNQLNTKSDTNHTHTGVYEPTITKRSAFNKNYGGTGIADSVAHSDHNHDDDYEHSIGTKGTAFNKNFGTSSDTVAEGDHTHSNYMPMEIRNTAYNKNFGKAPGEVAEGNHFHPAEKITYDNTGNILISSSTVQGAINQLDNQIGIFSISENTYLTAGYSVQTEVPIGGIDTPVKVAVPLSILGISHNAVLNNGSSIIVHIDPEPEKLIEGTITMTLTVSTTDTIALSIAVDDTILGERVVSNNGILTITKYLSRLPVDSFTISPYLTNLDNTNNIMVESMNIAWEGAPQGALVASGVVVDHADITGTGAANGVHTTSDIQDLDSELLSKADKLPSAPADNLMAFDANGNIKDAGHTISDVSNKADKVSGATANKIAILTSAGNLAEGTNVIADLALKTGSTSNRFKVANSTIDSEAVPKGQLVSILSNYTLSTELDTHLNATNPHNITPIVIGAATSSHTHGYADVPGLSDDLDDRYSKISTAGQHNIVAFGIDSLEDTGISYINKLLDGEVME